MSKFKPVAPNVVYDAERKRYIARVTRHGKYILQKRFVTQGEAEEAVAIVKAKYPPGLSNTGRSLTKREQGTLADVQTDAGVEFSLGRRRSQKVGRRLADGSWTTVIQEEARTHVEAGVRKRWAKRKHAGAVWKKKPYVAAMDMSILWETKAPRLIPLKEATRLTGRQYQKLHALCAEGKLPAVFDYAPAADHYAGSHFGMVSWNRKQWLLAAETVQLLKELKESGQRLIIPVTDRKGYTLEQAE